MIFRLMKWPLVVFIFFSSGLALWFQYVGHFDPVQAAVELKKAQKRDQALDIIAYAIENHIGDRKTLQTLHDAYRYTPEEMAADLILHGAVQGNVFNMYSGIGCIGADLMLFGDVRDLVKQAYNYAAGKEVDHLIAALSGIGIATTAAELTGGGIIVDAGISVVKTSVKYVTKTFKKIPDSIMKAAMAGKKFSTDVYKKIWLLFQQGHYSIPNTASVLSKISHTRLLDTALEVTKKLPKGGMVLITRTGQGGLKTYETFKRIGLGKFFVSAFKKNPRAVFGISKLHNVLHTFKIFSKHGILTTLAVLTALLAFFLALFPSWVPLIAWVLSGAYFVWRGRRLILFAFNPGHK